MISLPVCVSRLPVGSSAKIIAGLFTIALAIATRWRSPPESSFGLCLALSERPTLFNASSAISREFLVLPYIRGSSTFSKAEARGSKLKF